MGRLYNLRPRMGLLYSPTILVGGHKVPSEPTGLSRCGDETGRSHDHLIRVANMEKLNRVGLCFCVALAAVAIRSEAAEPVKSLSKTESFDRDPGWEGHNNRIVPKQRRT